MQIIINRFYCCFGRFGGFYRRRYRFWWLFFLLIHKGRQFIESEEMWAPLLTQVKIFNFLISIIRQELHNADSSIVCIESENFTLPLVFTATLLAYQCPVFKSIELFIAFYLDFNSFCSLKKYQMVNSLSFFILDFNLLLIFLLMDMMQFVILNEVVTFY